MGGRSKASFGRGVSRRSSTFVVALGLIISSLAAVTSPAIAARKPDLVVSKLGGVPETAAIGTPFKVAATVANRGKGAAGASVVRFYVSFDQRKDSLDVRLEGAGPIGRLAPGATSKRSVTITLPQTTPQDDVFLLACADDKKDVGESSESNNCRSSSMPISVAPPVTSLDLIERDLERGLITEDEAAIYKVQSAFGAPGLPSRYEVPIGEERLDAGHVIKEVAEQWLSLSEATRVELSPYFSPPNYDGAWMSYGGTTPVAARSQTAGEMCRGGTANYPLETNAWSSIDTEHFRFWYYTVPDLCPGCLLEGFNADPDGSRFLAESLAAIAEEVYDKETLLFEREPLSDEAEPCNGGDGRIDVFAAKLSTAAAAQVHPFPPGGILRPGWMHISPSYANTTTKIRDVFAHEFAHTIQLAYEYAQVPNRGIDYMWLEEATSNWAVDYVYPDDNFEHQFAKEYLLEHGFDNPLNVTRGSYSGAVGNPSNGYEDYLFLFFVTRKANDPTIMRTIWNKTETLNSVDAVDQGAPGGFLELWPEFAKYNMNRGEYDHYKDWDDLNWAFDLNGQIQPRVDVTLGGRSRRTILMPGNANRSVLQLATKYTVFEFVDPRVRRVTFHDYGFRDEAPSEALYHDVLAWIELETGEIRVEDWNDGEDVTFCRDKVDENLKRVVLLYANGVPNDQGAGEPQAGVFFPETREAAVKVGRGCSWPSAYSGSASGSFTSNGVTEAWSANYNMTLQYSDDVAARYHGMGTAQVAISGTDDRGCTYQGVGEIPMSGLLYIYDFEDAPEYEHSVSNGDPASDGRIQVTEDCPLRSPETIPWSPLQIVDAAVANGMPFEPGTTLSGSRSYQSQADPETPVQWTWSLAPAD